MLRPKQSAQVYLYMEPVDMRKSAALVEQEMALSPALKLILRTSGLCGLVVLAVLIDLHSRRIVG